MEQHYAEPNDDDNYEHVLVPVIENEIRNYDNQRPSKMTKSTNDDVDETMDMTYNQEPENYMMPKITYQEVSDFLEN